MDYSTRRYNFGDKIKILNKKEPGLFVKYSEDKTIAFVIHNDLSITKHAIDKIILYSNYLIEKEK